eukprot:CAMPEP_0118925086 /NCGR_PEP_ID=MMETSP1169-20130426/3015_1 /TAXON_ID=36882 /ORGANISM="Pyramimonas obovata, Strain CCMP722" /LENGTH=152 /DNA_ID=CAMNT_0006866287 /DNA_START=96 /DNA_END=554 /DNA_ORIENTATION=-
MTALSTSGAHMPNTGKLPAGEDGRLSHYQNEMDRLRTPRTPGGTALPGFWEACPEKVPPFMRAKSSYQVNRSVLEWFHLPEEKWKSENHSQFVSNWRPQTPKRHNDNYYRAMSGRGTPSSRERNHGHSGMMQRGLGNVYNVQVPHQSCYPDL